MNWERTNLAQVTPELLGGDRATLIVCDVTKVALREVVSGAREDLVLIGRHIRRSAAGFMLNRDHWYGPNAEAFGHDGAGGSYAFADPIAGISVAYVMNQMQVNSEVDLRGKDLLGAIYAAM